MLSIPKTAKRHCVTVPLPSNLTEGEEKWYEPYKDYEYSPQKVKYLKNVFLGFSGFAINKNGLVKDCHHQYPSQRNDYLTEAASYYHDIVDHPENLITIDDENVYLAIHHPWFNYYHWLCESIFRLWLVRKKLNKLTLILPDYYHNTEFIRQSLEPFKINSFFFIPAGKSLLINKLCLPQLKPICDSYNRMHLRQVRRFYHNYVLREKRISYGPIERLYISRKFAGRRRVQNEDQVLEVLSRFGFTIFYPEENSFWEQVAIFSQAKYVVGEHGSGLTNMLFMSKNSSVLELHQNKTNELNHPSPLFWYMADALGINYYHQSCGTYGKEDYFEGEYLIDYQLLAQNLGEMLAAKGAKKS
jgi:hypothetical protein